MAFDPKKFNTPEYVRQIVEAVEAEQPTLVEILLEEYAAKAYRQGRQDEVVYPRRT
jgi:hypothetical protein